MRVDVKKFLFVGIAEKSTAFFDRAQELGIIQFVGDSTNTEQPVSAAAEQLIYAIKLVRSLPMAEQEELLEDPLTAALAISHLHHKREKLQEQQYTLAAESARVHIFGDFSLDDIAYIEHASQRTLQFFCARRPTHSLQDLPEAIFYVGGEGELDYYVAISSTSIVHPHLIPMQLKQPLGELHSHYKQIADELHSVEAKLQAYVRYYVTLHRALTAMLNAHNLAVAQSLASSAIGNTLFTITGWVPANKVGQLQRLCRQADVYVDEVLPKPGEIAPTYLENVGMRRLGEDLVHVYDTPSNRDKDPSLWVVTWFALFFAMIVNDAGYGLLFLSVALYIRYKAGILYGLGKRVWKLSLLLFLSCIAWGVLSSSFFSITLSADNPLRRFSLTQLLAEKKAAYHMTHRDDVWHYWTDKIPEKAIATTPQEFLAAEKNTPTPIFNKFIDNIMMELALFIGCIHICLSLIRSVTSSPAQIGWIAFIIGGYCYLPYFLNATSLIHYAFGFDKQIAAQKGLMLLSGGAAIAFIIALIKKKWGGLLEVMNAIQIFSDVMSYLRLYALALAGAVVASTTNEFAEISGVVVGAILLLSGHLVNMVLAVMGGVIHGLRLNFLEWYRYSFEGGGKRFRPLFKISQE